MHLLGFEDSVLVASLVLADLATIPTIPRPGSKKSDVGISGHAHRRALYSVFLVALIAPSTISAVPLKATFDCKYVLDSVHVYSLGRRGSSDGSSNGGISMSTWLPVLAIAIVFMLASLVVCIRRFAVTEPATPRTPGSTGASGTRTGSNGTAPRTGRRPRRTPSQVSTKSLPPYMKEPGEQELVLFRGPLEAEDDRPPPMPTLAEDDEDPSYDTAFNISLARVESYDTMADASTTNLIRRPPELHHTDVDVAPRRSADAHSLGSSAHSHESNAGLLGSHQRTISTDVPDPRGEAPSYSEAVSQEPTMATISLNDPEPNNAASVPREASSANADSATGDLASSDSHSRFSFLRNPFHSNNSGSSSSHAPPPPPSVRAPSPAVQPRSGSVLSRVSSNESHNSNHSHTRSGNHSRSQSNSNILRAFRPHSKLPVSTSTISLDSISAPLTHTVTRAEFHAPKGGLLTAEQIKLITSREAMEKFGMPYGPDAVAAFSLSREQVVPPPDFDSVAGADGQPSASGSGSTGTSATPGPNPAGPTPGISASPHSLSSASASHLSPYPDMRSVSRTSTVMTYATARESDEHLDDDQSLYLQAVQAYASDSEADEADVPLTARPVTPTTAEPFSLAGNRVSVA